MRPSNNMDSRKITQRTLMGAPVSMRQALGTLSVRGFTLIELMITICVVAVVCSMAAPSFAGLMASNRISSQTNEFMSALKLANEVGEICEEEGHHPDITISWGYCKIVFQTHKINGLHENDFIMAARVNDLASKLSMDASHASAKMCRVA